MDEESTNIIGENSVSEKDDMKNTFTAILALSGAAVLTGSAQAQTSPPASGLVRGAFDKPSAATPSGSTTFTPTGTGNLFVAQLLAKTPAAQRPAMQQYANQINQMVEKAYMDYGYEKNDVGVAFGGFLETCWEISKGTFKVGESSAEDAAKTRATVRQMQNALLAAPAYKTLPPKNKQLLYESCTFMMGSLVLQWQAAASDGAKKAAVQKMAGQQLESLFGVSAGSLARKADGTFISMSPNPQKSVEAVAVAATGAKTKAAPIAAAASKGPLPAASTHGARIFIKYVFRTTETSFDQLILFPSGAAFTDIPSKPVARFDEATLRAGLKPYDIGTWKQAGNTIVLNFPAKKRETVTTLRKVPRGWYDGTGKLDPDNSYDTYFPVVPVTPAQLAGAWHSKSLFTSGGMGGGTAFVAAGSSSDRVYNANGTFAGKKESFASATTANMGDAFKGGGDVGVYSNKNKNGLGRWRLDGPLLTTEENGQRTVTPAFILPHWNKKGPAELLIDGDWWQRPEKK